MYESTYTVCVILLNIMLSSFCKNVGYVLRAVKLKNDTFYLNLLQMPLYDGFEEDAYSDTSTFVDDNMTETDSLSVRLKYSIRHAAIMLRWMFKIQ